MSIGPSIAERLLPSSARFDSAIRNALIALRVAAPGIVQSFDAAKQTVTVQVAIQENISFTSVSAGGITSTVAGVSDAPGFSQSAWETTQETVSLPILQDVPMVFPRGGGYTMTFPVAAGDECLLVFADACIDAWWQSGGVQAQVEERRHDLSDAFAILGTWSQPRVLTDYATDAVELRRDDGSAGIKLHGSNIIITAGNVTVNASGDVTMTVQGDAQIDASGVAIVEGDEVHITGDSRVQISGNAHTTIEGKDFLTHTHSGVATGGGVSGPVV